MTATSISGVGTGTAKRYTANELNAIINSPAIYLSGYVEAEDMVSSPPTTGNSVVFPEPLSGGSENYVVMLTTLNGGYAYVTDMDENSDGDFIGFSFLTEAECSMMYLVASAGIRPVA